MSSSASIEATARPICSDHCDGGMSRLFSSKFTRVDKADCGDFPELPLLKGGHEIDRIVGVQPKSAIAQRLQRLIS
jgi:hypothetical protein